MRVATWNMQGASAYGENSFLLLNSILNGENIDVMCLQECGCLSDRLDWEPDENPNIKHSEYYIPTRSRGVAYHVLHCEWGNSNDRCSLAIIIKGVYFNELCYSLYFKYSDDTRPLLGVYIKDFDCGFFTAHCPSGVSKFAQTYINQGLSVIKKDKANNIFSKFVVAGDFNIRAKDFTEIIGVKKHYPMNKSGEPVDTQKSGGCLDYCVTNSCLNPNNIEILDFGKYGQDGKDHSDHKMVIFDFKMR